MSIIRTGKSYIKICHEELRVIFLTLPHELFLRFLLSQAAGYQPAAKILAVP